MRITILGVPMAKQSFRFTRSGLKYQPKELINWAAQAKLQIINQLPKGFKPMTEPVILKDLTFVYPVPKNTPKYKINLISDGHTLFKESRPDLLDNLGKNILDVCQGVLFINDAQIVGHTGFMKKIYGSTPRIEFEIFTLEDFLKNGR